MEPHPVPTTTDLKKLRLRYAGTCVACGAALPQGAQALYHAASKTIRCVTCPGESAVIEPAPIESGSAGASTARARSAGSEA